MTELISCSEVWPIRSAESATTTPSRNEQVLARSTTVLATEVSLIPSLTTT